MNPTHLSFAPLLFGPPQIGDEGVTHQEAASSKKLILAPSKSLSLDTPTVKEASSGTGMPFAALTREGFFPQIRREVDQFREAESGADKQSVFDVQLIEEGLGNLRDMYFYTRGALASAAPMFEGEKAMIDHSTSVEDEIQPERSINDHGGHYENSRVENGPQGQAVIRADLVVPAGSSFAKVRDNARHAIEFGKKYPDKYFMGLSISADGSSTAVPIDEWIAEAGAKYSTACLPKLLEAKAAGADTVNVVDTVTGVNSCDMVTKPGAGGKILAEKGGS